MPQETMLSSLHVMPEVAASYDLLKSKVVEEVNHIMLAKSNLHALIGGENSVNIMFTNHHNHGEFMATVLSTNNFDLLERTLPWVYRSYANHGFSFDYFPVELDAWTQAIERVFAPAHATPIIAIYKWMRQRHDKTVEEAKRGDVPVEDAFPPSRHPQFDAFMALLLSGKHRECLALCTRLVAEGLPLPSLFVSLLQPAMYRVGTLWENDEISVAKEHLCSSIIAKTITLLSTNAPVSSAERGKVIVTSAPNEYHEIGAWMVATSLELAGFDVQYLGANTPISELIHLVGEEEPDLIAVSVALSSHIKFVHEILDVMAKDAKAASIPILIGGLAFRTNPEIVHALGHRAAFAQDCNEAVGAALKLVPAENRPANG
ncbi:MAG: cobalamin-dependent protein [Myxococcota bacterium]|nr:cobalamin-dependent protein [Myxococcota bacterium]